MPFTSEEFKGQMEEIQQRNQDWFSKHPPIGNNTSNSIHHHYYVYLSAKGYQLRFNASSDLPIEIRNEIKELFNGYSKSHNL